MTRIASMYKKMIYNEFSCMTGNKIVLSNNSANILESFLESNPALK